MRFTESGKAAREKWDPLFHVRVRRSRIRSLLYSTSISFNFIQDLLVVVVGMTMAFSSRGVHDYREIFEHLHYLIEYTLHNSYSAKCCQSQINF